MGGTIPLQVTSHAAQSWQAEIVGRSSLGAVPRSRWPSTSARADTRSLAPTTPPGRPDFHANLRSGCADKPFGRSAPFPSSEQPPCDVNREWARYYLARDTSMGPEQVFRAGELGALVRGNYGAPVPAAVRRQTSLWKKWRRAAQGAPYGLSARRPLLGV